MAGYLVPPNHFADAGRARRVNAMRVTVTVRASGVREEPADARLSIRYVRWVMIARSGMRVACGRVCDAVESDRRLTSAVRFSKGRAVTAEKFICALICRDPIQSI